jgi:HAD superfamily hydrolase (TIGR01509 family)
VIARPKALLLDAGNTLVYLDHAAVARAAESVGLHIAPDTLRAAEPHAKRRYEAAMLAGISHEDGWTLHMQALFEIAGLSVTDAALGADAARIEHDHFNLWRSVPEGLPAHLARAKARGLALGVISNSEGRLSELFARLSLSALFDVVVDSGLEGVRKPDPAIFHLGLSRMHVQAADSVYAGDIPHVDVDGARAVGMGAVLIDTLEHYPAYTEAPRFQSVAALLQTWGIA